jgi:CRP-like cAMP-binding protein
MSTRSTTVAHLSRVASFDQVRPRDLRELAAHTDHVHLPAGSVLVREGDKAREFIVVLWGEVSASHTGGPADRFGAGTEIGGRALREHEHHDRTWTAETDVDLLVVNGPAFRFAHRAIAA